MAKACEICHRKIGAFDDRYTTTDKKLICTTCFEKYKKFVPLESERENRSAADIAESTDSPEALAYCQEHGLPAFSEYTRKKEVEKQKAAHEKEVKEKQETEKRIKAEKENKIVLAEVDDIVGTVRVYGDRVTICQKNLISQHSLGDRTIYFKDIESIEYKKPGFMTNGHIIFATTPDMATSSVLGNNPDIFYIRCVSEEARVNSAKVYETAMSQWKKAKSEAQTTNTVPYVDPADEIVKYKKLLDMGVLTKEDFEAKKKQLLGL